MNYYEHHLGDYARDAGHLSLLEEGAYRRLIDAYYARESALPLDMRECKKLARVTRNPAEHRAVEYVLRVFFVEGVDGYHQKRCDEEIQRFKDKREAARTSANARWSHSDRNANASELPMRTHGKRICETHALQSPVSNLQSPTKNTPLPLASEGECVGDSSIKGSPRQNGTNPRALGTNPRAIGNGKGLERKQRNGKPPEEPWTPPISWEEREAEERLRDQREREEAAHAEH